MKVKRVCPDKSGPCIAPRLCGKTKPCWWLKTKETHDIIGKQAAIAGKGRQS
jgi:hypothetical protein